MKLIKLITTAIFGWWLVGCTSDQLPAAGKSPDTEVQLTITAKPMQTDSAGQLILPIVLRLHNPTHHTKRLIAGTSCAILRWKILHSNKIIQTKPNQLCHQTVATKYLPPGQTIKTTYKLILQSSLYACAKKYELQYTFWRYHGAYKFSGGCK